MHRPLRAVSLDLDNTLWDTPPVLARAEARLHHWLATHCPAVARRYDATALAGVRLAVAAERPDRAHDLSFIRSEALRRVVRAEGYAEQLAEQAFDVFLAARHEIVPYADVPDALARLATQLPLYALSNGNACVRRAGLGGHFSAAIDAAAAGAAKPDPRIFVHLLQIAAVPAGSVLHVGDDPYADVAGACAAGLRTAWINRCGASWPAHLPRAEYEITHLGELALLVERLLDGK